MKIVYDSSIQDMVCCADKPVFGVMQVSPLENFALRITFNNGEERVFDAHRLLEDPFYNPLKNERLFMRAYTDGVAVIWNDELDVAPEYLYEHSEPA